MRIRTAEVPPTGIGWASQPSGAGTVAALFPEQPWLWTPPRASYWGDVDREWIAVADLALVGQPNVYPRWVGGFAGGGQASGLWQLLPAGTRLRFAHRGAGIDFRQRDVAVLSLAWRRGPLLSCAVAEHGRASATQPPLWALLATALIVPVSDPLARGLAAPEEVIERARQAAAEALAAIRPEPLAARLSALPV